ncbi:MAG: YraN family protein [Eubacteriales bacterium]|nr:YraN family protein [Eubacteriales bacterium]
MNDGRKTGRLYESRAADALIAAGYELLARNYYFRGGEIDIIARKDDCIIFVEVRYRKSMRYGSAISSVTPAKCRRIRRGAACYLYAHGLTDVAVRFDLISFDGETMTHLADCM